MKTNEAEYQNTAYGCGLIIAQLLGIAAWVSIYFLVLTLTSCSSHDTPLPECVYEYSIDNGKLNIVIISDADSVEICRSNGRCLTIVSHYYGCISMAVESGEVLTIDGMCEIVIP